MRGFGTVDSQVLEAWRFRQSSLPSEDLGRTTSPRRTAPKHFTDRPWPEEQLMIESHRGEHVHICRKSGAR